TNAQLGKNRESRYLLVYGSVVLGA
ncbi:hypothetical protein EZS27_029573, partial [termite gut metagenome]